VIVDAASYHGSAHYTGRAHVEEMFAAELSELVGQPITTVFTAHNVSWLYTYVKLELYIAGLPAGAAGDLAASTHQLALNSLQRGAAEVTVQMWSQQWVCARPRPHTVRVPSRKSRQIPNDCARGRATKSSVADRSLEERGGEHLIDATPRGRERRAG